MAHHRGDARRALTVALNNRGAARGHPEHDEQSGHRPRPHPVGPDGLCRLRRPSSIPAVGMARGTAWDEAACSSSPPSRLSPVLPSQVMAWDVSILSLPSVSSRVSGVGPINPLCMSILIPHLPT